MPRTGVLDTLAVTFTTTQTHNIGVGEVTVYAQLFIAARNSNLYFAIPESRITLTPDLTGTVPTGTILFGSAKDMDFAVSQFSKILLVIYTISTDTRSANDLFGVINAGLSINNQ